MLDMVSVGFTLFRDMDNTNLLKILFQIFAFGIFIFQMQNSLSKYLPKPTIQQTSTVHFDEIHKPTIYVCQVFILHTIKPRINDSLSRITFGIETNFLKCYFRLG